MEWCRSWLATALCHVTGVPVLLTFSGPKYSSTSCFLRESRFFHSGGKSRPQRSVSDKAILQHCPRATTVGRTNS
jgi:hypothetical protein